MGPVWVRTYLYVVLQVILQHNVFWAHLHLGLHYPDNVSIMDTNHFFMQGLNSTLYNGYWPHAIVKILLNDHWRAVLHQVWGMTFDPLLSRMPKSKEVLSSTSGSDSDSEVDTKVCALHISLWSTVLVHFENISGRWELCSLQLKPLRHWLCFLYLSAVLLVLPLTASSSHIALPPLLHYWWDQRVLPCITIATNNIFYLW